MPVYEWKCCECEISKEVIVPMSESNIPVICDNCNKPMTRVYSYGAFHLHGTDWPGKTIKGWKTHNPEESKKNRSPKIK